MHRSTWKYTFAVLLAAITATEAGSAFARTTPNVTDRLVLPVTNGASQMQRAQGSTGTSGARAADGAAPYSVGRRSHELARSGAPPGGLSDASAQERVAPHLPAGPSGTLIHRPTPSLDHEMAVPVPLAAGAVQIDSTYWDHQDMGSLGNRIVVRPNGQVHVTWQDDNCEVAPGGCPPNLSAPDPFPRRSMSYAWRDQTGWHSAGRIDDPDIRGCCVTEYSGGYGTIAVTNDGRAAIAQHMNEDGCDLRGALYTRDTAGASAATAYLTPWTDYLFPQAAALPNGAFVMLAEIPLSPPSHFYEEVASFQVSYLPAEGPRFVCYTGWQFGAWQAITPPGYFPPDGYSGFPSLAAASDGRAGIAVTDFVDDVFLIESSNGTFLPGTITVRNLTNYSDAAVTKADSTSTEYRPYIHCHLAYQDTTPHVVWSELQARRIGAVNEVFDWRSQIRHWSSTTGLTTVARSAPGEADAYDNLDIGLNGPIAGFNTISMDWPQVGFSPDGFETYVVWQRYVNAEIDPTADGGLPGIITGVGFGDIMGSVRRQGTGWSAGQNLTQTPQTDERFHSIAAYNPGGRPHILYQSSATNQAGVAAIGDRGGEDCGPTGCLPGENFVRRIAFFAPRLTASVVSVDAAPEAPPATLRPFPNPARGVVRFAAEHAADGEFIEVFSVDGRRVARIPVAGGAAAWDGRSAAGPRVASGIYFARFAGASADRGTRFMLLK
jgi:hypothetical protein